MDPPGESETSRARYDGETGAGPGVGERIRGAVWPCFGRELNPTSPNQGQRRTLRRTFKTSSTSVMRYCAMPSTAKVRYLAYFSPIFRTSSYAGSFRQAWTASTLGY